MNWLPIPGYEGRYEVSDTGLIQTIPGKAKDERILKAGLNDRGYRTVDLYDGKGNRRTLRVHRLVLETFVGPCPPGLIACHNNGYRTDNRVENLRWDTHKANTQDLLRHGNHKQANQVECHRGHRLEEPNLVPSSLKDGRRDCLACSRARQRVRTGYGTDVKSVADTIYQEISS